eukprot:4054522-Prymnesium_polylepis.1
MATRGAGRSRHGSSRVECHAVRFRQPMANLLERLAKILRISVGRASLCYSTPAPCPPMPASHLCSRSRLWPAGAHCPTVPFRCAC